MVGWVLPTIRPIARAGRIFLTRRAATPDYRLDYQGLGPGAWQADCMLGLRLGWEHGNDVSLVGKGPFKALMPWLHPESDKWIPVEKETPSRNFIEDFGLVNLYRDLGISSIF